MRLSNIKIHTVRNILSANVSLNPKFNIFYGVNGSGKTSFLESIYLLTTGRSFRTRHSDELIQFTTSSFTLSGVASNWEGTTTLRMGVERKKTEGFKIHVNDEPCQSIGELAKHIPVQLLNTDSYSLLETGPENRRQFLDWGVFHVEHVFFPTWQRYKRALQQRNAALKNSRQDSSIPIHIWDQELSETGILMDELRQAYLQLWNPEFSKIISQMLNIGEVTLHYNRGWDEQCPLEQIIKESTFRDKMVGYTTRGPHRAELSFFIDGIPAKSVLSRGQLKLFICAMFLARSIILYKKTATRCLFLIDDLCSELDSNSSEMLMEALERLEGHGQVICTVIEKNAIEKFLEGKEHKMFHVEQGEFKNSLDSLGQ